MPVCKEKKRTKDGQNIYYIRPYVTDEFGKRKQITRHNSKEWIGREGYKMAQAEDNILSRKKKVILYQDITYEDVSIKFLKLKEEAKEKESTVYTYESAIKAILQPMPFFKKKIINFTKEDNDYFRSYMSNSNYSLEYKNKLHHIHSGILDVAVQEFNLEINYEKQCGAFKLENEVIMTDEERIKYITYENFQIILNNIDNYIYYTFFYLLYFTGMRKGEALALSWNDIDFNKSTIKIYKTYTNKTKTGSYKITSTKTLKNRIVELDSNTLNIMKKFYNIESKKNSFSNEDFIFCGKHPLSTTTLSNKWKKAFENTNIQKITIHEIRHSHVSFLINEYVKKGNTDVAKFFLMMSNRMGHTLKVMQETYMHLFPGFQNEIVNLINSKNN